tara:strand:+ start:1048 stop:1209 length:162 start_codon:yes stop_codon:yes gene_type:complete
MKVVAEIVAAVILLISGSYIAPKMIEKFKKETFVHIHKGLPSIEKFSRTMANE